MAFSITQNISAQKIELSETPSYTGERPVKVEVLPKYVPLYVISVKELPSYFLNGLIPTSFPKYDESLTKEKNDIIALKWCDVSSNRLLLTDDAKIFVDKKTVEFKKKYNQK